MRPKLAPDIWYTCAACGKEYALPAWQQYGRTYCSVACRNKSRRGVKTGPRTPKEPVIRPCVICGKDFVVKSGRDFQKYCSLDCSYVGRVRHAPARTLTPEEAAWLAAVLDCEGSIIFQKGRTSNLNLLVGMTSLPFLERIHEVTGTGAIVKRQRYANPRWNQAWHWYCCGPNARALLQQILPWLIVKREKTLRALGEGPPTEHAEMA